MAFIVLLRKLVKDNRIVMRRLRAAVRFQKQKIGVALNDDGHYSFSFISHPQKRLIDLLAHMDLTYGSFGLGGRDIVALFLAA